MVCEKIHSVILNDLIARVACTQDFRCILQSNGISNVNTVNTEIKKMDLRSSPTVTLTNNAVDIYIRLVLL